ncbi:hypothetical protein [Inhella gelatinilytica]|uniref:Uncharacterized protein n=1 Tax=Inhella gelatinilytica TaxID=2795030 RepID=A0A931IW21_9BURK|nr:hypothetical protein [Inhella gelatinilytica]MBH9552987.1 hypothetical protein [Inhella gelatinilytica]
MGTFVGLFVLGGASSLTLGQAQTHRNTHLQLRLQDEVRATLRILEREVQRAGIGLAEAEAYGPEGTVYISPEPPTLNLRHRLPDSTEGTVQLRAVRLREGQLEMRVNDGGFQPLTDRSLLHVRRFDLQIEHHPSHPVHETGACAATPTLVERHVRLQMEAHVRGDPHVMESRTLALALPPILLTPVCP